MDFSKEISNILGQLTSFRVPFKETSQREDGLKFIDLGYIFPCEMRSFISPTAKVLSDNHFYYRFGQSMAFDFKKICVTNEIFYVSSVFILDSNFKIIAIKKYNAIIEDDKTSPILYVNLGSFVNQRFCNKFLRNAVFVENLDSKIKRVFSFKTLAQRKEKESQLNTLLENYIEDILNSGNE